MALDLKADSSRGTFRGGAASRGGISDCVAARPRGIVEHTDARDGRPQRRTDFCRAVLAVERRLTGPFPYSAAWGDIITGVVAVPVLWLLKDDAGARYTTAIGAWNLFGAADLVLAIAFGITSAEGSPLQLFPGPGSQAMQHAPWSFVPTVLVPIWLILHAIIVAQLRRAKVSHAARAVA
jgi:hypothetical protein